ncbi:MAG: ATP--guanido phosphotransferase [Opitutales bacterium]|nr:ATP--guanido phosphotransferase [Opitutales bacterium]
MSGTFDEFLTETASRERAWSSVPCALGVRVRLARNLAGTPFPGWAKAKRRREVLEKISAAAGKIPSLCDAFCFETDKLSALRRNFLIERHCISQDLSGDGAGAIIARNREIVLMVNEEDHLRIQAFAPGNDLGAAWASAREADKALAEHLDFAFSKKYGFLTACPTNAGTGLRISVMMHLPGFVMDGQMEKIVRALNAVGLTARGCFGEGSDARGCVFQISNEYTLGISEAETLALMRRWTSDIAEQELAARRRIFSRERADLADRIARAYGNLRYAVSLSADEATELLSLLRLACDAGYFPGETRERIDDLWAEKGRAHIACRAEFRGVVCDEARENLLRGRLFRETLSAIKPPAFPDFLK